MNSMRARWRNIVLLAKQFRFREIGQKLAHRVYYNNYSYCLRRDLQIPFPAPEAKIPIIIRRLEQGDITKLFANVADLPASDQADLYSRLDFWNAKVPTCYVGVAEDGAPTYIQWLMGPEQNEKIQAFFNGTFPVLAPDEALLENALTPAAFRGKGIMPSAMARIAEQGTTLGARYVLTFVEQHNIPSLKGCKKSGFLPHLIRHEQWFLFRRSLIFTKLPEGTPYPFDAEAVVREGA